MVQVVPTTLVSAARSSRVHSFSFSADVPFLFSLFSLLSFTFLPPRCRHCRRHCCRLVSSSWSSSSGQLGWRHATEMR